MASSYKIKRSNESKMLYFISSIFLSYRYIILLKDIILNKNTNLLLLFISSLALLLFFILIYMDRIIFLNSHIVFVFVPVLLIVKYDEVIILENIYPPNKKNDYHFMKEENQLCLKIKNKEYVFSTYNNENVIKILKEKSQGNTGGNNTR